ncbi:MAG: hypothetical protein E7164_00545 [Firmicutes bacterium]|nr:hypothetical protein [Bacillota bacterium]
MNKSKNGKYIIIIGIIGVLLLIGIFLGYRAYLKQEFDKLYNSDKVLSISLGVIPQKDILMEKNSLFKKVNQDNNFYLHITNDNTLFTYYLDWYYTIDPLKGYKLVQKEILSEDTVQNILKDINKIKIGSLIATNKNEYVTITNNKKEHYIKKEELLSIFQKYNILLKI